MALSNELISQFVKITNDKKEPAKESTAYGKIVVKDGKEYVQLDGSELLTPISTTTVVKDKDRVMVTIKNHTAIVTGDLTNPSASNKDVTEIGNKISEFEIVIADKVTTKQLEAEIARIEKLRTEELEATNAKIETLEGKVAKIDEIEADMVTVSGKVTANEAEIDTLRADIADFKDVTAERVDAVEGEFNTLKSDYATFEETVTTKITAAEGDIKDLQTNKLDAETAKVTYATIDFANINEAAVEKLFSDSGIIKDLIMSDGKVTGELVGVTIKGDIIEGNTVKADKLVILGTDGLYYKLNVDALGETTASSDEKYQNGLDGSAIIAESITAEKIAVDDLVAFGATIGGFHINNHAIYSGVKNSINNTTRGIYLGDDSQVNIGDQNNFLKYYKDENGQYKLEIQADSLRFGSSKTTIEEYIQNNVEIDPPSATKTVEGSEIVIDDGKQIHDFIIEGESYQETRSGKNLYNYRDVIYQGSCITTDDDGWITGTYDNSAGTSTLYFNYYTNNLNLKPGSNYTIVTEVKNVSGGGALVVSSAGENGQFTTYHSFSFSAITSGYVRAFSDVTKSDFSTMVKNYGLGTFLRFQAGQSGSITFRISVLEDTTITADNFKYEAYGVQPSPDYPSEIISVGSEYTNLLDAPKVLKINQWEYNIPLSLDIGTYSVGFSSYSSTGTAEYFLIALKNGEEVVSSIYVPFASKRLTFEVSSPVTQCSIYAQNTYNDSVGKTTILNNLSVQKGSGLTSHYIPFGKYGIEVIHSNRNYYPNSGEYKEMGHGSNDVLDNTITLNGYPSLKTLTAWCGPYINLKKLMSGTNLKVGDTVTYSVYFITNFTPTRNVSFSLYRARTAGKDASFSVPVADVTPNKWIRIKVTFTLTEYSLTSTAARLETDYYDTSDQYYFGNNRQNFMWFACPQLEKGTEMTDWVDHKQKISVFELDQPLRKTPNGIRDLARVQNGVLYVDRKVGSAILDGSENGWQVHQYATDTDFLYWIYQPNLTNKMPNCATFGDAYAKDFIKCDKFNVVSEVDNRTTLGTCSMYSNTSTDIMWLRFNVKQATLDEFKNWLSVNNVELTYGLAEPYTEEIGPVDISLNEDEMNIYYVDDDLEPNIVCKYSTEYSGYNGQSVYSVTDEFYVSTSKETPTGGEWSEETPTWSSGKYLWTRSKIIYVNPYSVIYTVPMCDSSWEAVNEVQIGGRNLFIKNALRTIAISSYSWNDYILSCVGTGNCGIRFQEQLFTKGETYTLSFKFKKTGGTLKTIGGHMAGFTQKIFCVDGVAIPNKTYNYGTGYTLNDTTDTHTVYVTLEYNASSADDNALYIQVNRGNYGTAVNFDIWDIKLEKGNKPTDWTPAPEDFITNIADLQTQVDGKIQTYSQTSDPSVAWTTIDMKNLHTGDLWYNPDTKKTQRWSGASWVNLENAEAQAAATLAGKKAQIFTSQPTPPYYVGDLWITSLSAVGTVKTCYVSRTSGSYVASDWVEVNNPQIGGTNLLENSSFTESKDKWSTYSGGGTIVEKDGVRCAHFIGALNTTCYVSQDVLADIQHDDLSQTYVFSADVCVENIVKGTTNFHLSLYLSSQYDNNGTTEWLGATWVAGSGNLFDHNNKGWVRVIYVVRFAKKPINHVNVMVHARDFTGDLYFKNLKFEKGNKPTQWSPSPQDAVDNLNKVNNDLGERITKQKAFITEEADRIKGEVLETTLTKDEFDNWEETTFVTEVEQRAGGVFINLNETHNGKRFSDLEGDVKDINENLDKNFSFTKDGMIIGSGDSAVKLIVDNKNGIIFERADGYQLGYWDGNNFYAGNIVIRVDERAQFGNYAYIPKSDGSLMFTRVK